MGGCVERDGSSVGRACGVGGWRRGEPGVRWIGNGVAGGRVRGRGCWVE